MKRLIKAPAHPALYLLRLWLFIRPFILLFVTFHADLRLSLKKGLSLPSQRHMAFLIGLNLSLALQAQGL
jgi:hypothetical protein